MLKIAFDDIYKHPLPEGHRFPMEKYDLLTKQLLYEGTCEEQHFFKPIIQTENEKYILSAHTKSYVEELYACQIEARKARKIGFPLSPELVKRERIITNGTISACDFALQNGIAMNIAGGTHHAYRNRGEAFCMLNDQAVGAHYLLKNKLAKSILIVDLDVHQGNGTADIFKDDHRVFTFSVHGKNNYPFKKEVSDLDIALDDNTKDEEYLEILKLHLPKLVDLTKPDFIFFLSGVDIVNTDKLGKLGCTVAGCKERDRYVLETCFEKGIPLEVSMGGGYSEDIKIIIEAHANTFRLAQEIYF